jgi:hypothetical protein
MGQVHVIGLFHIATTATMPIKPTPSPLTASNASATSCFSLRHVVLGNYGAGSGRIQIIDTTTTERPPRYTTEYISKCKEKK